jgi:hypothetical protein
MTNYYFYNNFKLSTEEGNIYLFLLAITLESKTMTNELRYLNRIFSKTKISSFSNKFKKINFSFNYSIFFLKFKIISQILYSVFSVVERVKIWNMFIIIPLLSFNNCFSNVSFNYFKLDLNLRSSNILNYSFINYIIYFDIKKNPTRFIFFYFINNIYKIFNRHVFSLLISKNFLYTSLDIEGIFFMFKADYFINFIYRDIIYI